MKRIPILSGAIPGVMCALALMAAGCFDGGDGNSGTDTVVKVVRDTIMIPGESQPAAYTDPNALPVTLPVLDAFLADSSFVGDLKARLALTDQQIDSLRAVAREGRSGLTEEYTGEYSGSTGAALALAEERITAAIGREKALQLAGLVRERWNGGLAAGADSLRAGIGGSDSAGMMAPNAVPSDTRIVVNAPAFRMDLFRNGALVKSYRIAIGYPEFPLPTGVRSARTVIFNPTWTPPDEPWVESSNKVKVGQTVPAGSSLNPLGIAKIPIGLPSLIHSGKSQGQLGRFGSHGCVGLTNEQMRDFAPRLAAAAGTGLNDSAITAYGKRPKETKEVMLQSPVPVELRYETIVVQDGKLYIHRDLYDRNTNTEATLQRVLAAYGVGINQLTEDERRKVTAGLASMSRDARGRTDSAAASGDTARTPRSRNDLTRTIAGQKEVVIEIAALQGKGYPAPDYEGQGTEPTLAGGRAR